MNFLLLVIIFVFFCFISRKVRSDAGNPYQFAEEKFPDEEIISQTNDDDMPELKWKKLNQKNFGACRQRRTGSCCSGCATLLELLQKFPSIDFMWSIAANMLGTSRSMASHNFHGCQHRRKPTQQTPWRKRFQDSLSIFFCWIATASITIYEGNINEIS